MVVNDLRNHDLGHVGAVDAAIVEERHGIVVRLEDQAG
jgi:hypothetical protein